MSDELKDTYFLNRKVALKTAKKQNRIMCTKAIDGLQICYYDGKEFKKAPKNCINVPLNNIAEYFGKTSNRFPKTLNFNKTELTFEEKKNINNKISQMIDEASKMQDSISKQIMKRIKLLDPDFSDKELRVYIPACRETVVMQHLSKYIANTFEKKGYKVKYHIQKNDMQGCFVVPDLKGILKFNPHIIVRINHFSNSFLSPSIFNIIWFQDPMDHLTDDKKIKIRNRDIFFSYQTLYDNLLIKKGVKKEDIHRQYVSCVDSNIFYEDSNIKRENKIVFVGSHYSIKSKSDLSTFLCHNENIYFELIRTLENGEDLSEENIFKIFTKHKQRVPMLEGFTNHIQQGMIRNIAVNWMCTITSIPVELYGYHWDELNIDNINKHFKGSASKEEVNKIYNSAKYVLLASGQVINTQRLAEVIMCGAIPVVYDSRNITDEKETWDDKCLYFKTKQDLEEILKKNKTPKKRFTKEDKATFTFDNLVKIVEQTINKKLNKHDN